MSDVRMCDKCGRVFSLLEDGWQQMTVRQKNRGRDALEAVMHACNSCALTGPPTAELEAPETPAQP